MILVGILFFSFFIHFLFSFLSQYNIKFVRYVSYFGYSSSFLLLWVFFYSLYFFYLVVLNEYVVYVNINNWFTISLLNIQWVLYFDYLTCIMLIVVTSISSCVHFYSIEYMFGDPRRNIFMVYLTLFTLFMVILVTSGNLIQLFLGWEGVGICSYLLINFWYTRLKANKAAMMAIFVNKIGDIALLVALGIVFTFFKSFDFNLLNNVIFLDAFYSNSMNNILFNITILFIVASVAKSAQVGLHVWLPEAMEGPTPVSSLIHAATMVTAGIFLVLRTSFIFQLVPEALLWIVSLGSITTFLAASIGIFQNDIKKIIAYSTCSQLGYMFLSCGLSSYQYSFFHLFNHAFFKALLFLAAGYIIHSFSDEQDIRKMGNMIKLFTFSYVLILFASFSLMGIPFLSGFYSKEHILENFFSLHNIVLLNNFKFFYFFYIISLSAACCTIFYSIKLIILVFFSLYSPTSNCNSNSSFFSYISTRLYTPFIIFSGKNNKNFFSYYININTIHFSSSLYTLIPLFVLFILSLISGFFFSDLMVGDGSVLPGYSFPSLLVTNNQINKYYYLVLFEFNDYIHGITLVWVFYFIFLSLFFYLSYFLVVSYIYTLINTYFYFIYTVFVEKYIFFNKLLIDSSIILLLASNFLFYLTIDKGLLEKSGPFGIYKSIKRVLFDVRTIENYSITHYFFFFFFFFFLFAFLI